MVIECDYDAIWDIETRKSECYYGMGELYQITSPHTPPPLL